MSHTWNLFVKHITLQIWHAAIIVITLCALTLTNVPRTFQSTCVIETGLSDFHLMKLTIMRKAFKKQRPRIINYRSFEHFPNEEFRKSLIDNVSNQMNVNSDNGFNRFCKISINTLNSFSPIKNKFVRANQIPFITKELSRETVKR